MYILFTKIKQTNSNEQPIFLSHPNFDWPRSRPKSGDHASAEEYLPRAAGSSFESGLVHVHGDTVCLQQSLCSISTFPQQGSGTTGQPVRKGCLRYISTIPRWGSAG